MQDLWVYYKLNYTTDTWVLFRKDKTRYQIYHQEKGWLDDNELYLRMMKGEVDDGDIIPEAEVEKLLARANA